MEVRLGLPFFAARLQVDKSKLSYTILQRKFDGEYPTVRHAAIKVEGIENYVFDIEEDIFVKLGRMSDSNISCKTRVTLVLQGSDVVLWDKNEHMVKYTQEEFLKMYSFKVVNDSLK